MNFFIKICENNKATDNNTITQFVDKKIMLHVQQHKQILKNVTVKRKYKLKKIKCVSNTIQSKKTDKFK